MLYDKWRVAGQMSLVAFLRLKSYQATIYIFHILKSIN